MNITPDECRELAGLLGICWHQIEIDIPLISCSCGQVWHGSVDVKEANNHISRNPDFRDPRVVLREMRKRKDWYKFLLSIGGFNCYRQETEEMIPMKYILDDTGMLAKKALEWLRRINAT